MLEIFLVCLGLSAAEAATFETGIVSQACLECICKQESNCQSMSCRMDVDSLFCGFFQIKEAYWIDCGQLGSSLYACSTDLTCASQCVQNYMERYAAHYGCPATCESYAREHIGGPRGCKSSATLSYWHRVQSQPGCSNV